MMKLKGPFIVWMALLAILTVGLVTPVQTAQAATIYYVDDVNTPCLPSTTIHSNSIQTAVTDAINNGVHTILVCPGSYLWFSVTGASGLVIRAAVQDGSAL